MTTLGTLTMTVPRNLELARHRFRTDKIRQMLKNIGEHQTIRSRPFWRQQVVGWSPRRHRPNPPCSSTYSGGYRPPRTTTSGRSDFRYRPNSPAAHPMSTTDRALAGTPPGHLWPGIGARSPHRSLQHRPPCEDTVDEPISRSEGSRSHACHIIPPRQRTTMYTERSERMRPAPPARIANEATISRTVGQPRLY